MASNQSITNALTSAAAGSPKKASGDAGSVERDSVKDMIEADRYLCGKAAGEAAATAGNNKLPFQISRIRFGRTT